MIKKWEVTINYLFGLEFIKVPVKANTERKASDFALEKVKKERGDHIMHVCSIELIDDKKKEVEK